MKFDKFLGRVRESDKSVVVSGSDGNSIAANITVNAISPDEDGNIELTARWVPMPEKTEGGDNIIVSSVCGSQDLAQFYERMQGAVFNIDGNTVRTQEDSDGYYYTGEVDLKYYVEWPDGSWIVRCIEGDYGDGNVDPEKHYYLHTQIHEMLDRYSVCSVNGRFAGEYDLGDVRIGAYQIPIYEDNLESQNVGSALEAIDYSSMGAPDYGMKTTEDVEYGILSPGADYYPYRSGWVFVNVVLNGESFKVRVIIEGEQIAEYGCVGQNMNERFAFHFPVNGWTSWRIEEDTDSGFKGSYEIIFVPTMEYYIF